LGAKNTSEPLLFGASTFPQSLAEQIPRSLSFSESESEETGVSCHSQEWFTACLCTSGGGACKLHARNASLTYCPFEEHTARLIKEGPAQINSPADEADSESSLCVIQVRVGTIIARVPMINNSPWGGGGTTSPAWASS